MELLSSANFTGAVNKRIKVCLDIMQAETPMERYHHAEKEGFRGDAHMDQEGV